MSQRVRVRAIYRGPLASKAAIELPQNVLKDLGKCIVKAVIDEAKKDFAKRGWSLNAPDGKHPLHKSFQVRVRGDSTIEILSSFPMLQRLVDGEAPHPMTWMTQEAKDRNPTAYELSPREKELGMKKTGKVSKGGRLPLIVPLTDAGGTVVFRVAPLKIGDAWVHPGVAKFTFLQRGIEKGKKLCVERIKEELVRQLVGGT